jgi:putative ABC transport system permease protein
MLRAVSYPKFAIVRLIVSEAMILGVIGVGVDIALTLLMRGAINGYLLGDPLVFTATGLKTNTDGSLPSSSSVGGWWLRR